MILLRFIHAYLELPFNRRNFVNRVVVLIIALALVPALSFAQTTDKGTMRGRVLDQNGATIVNAVVLVTNELTGIRRETRTQIVPLITPRALF